MQDIRQKLLATFQLEHRDHVEQIRRLLSAISTASGAPGADLDEAFRRAHSLKGAARAVDLRPVEGLAHRMETLFSRVRQGALPFDQAASGAIEQALNASEDCVSSLGQNREPAGFEQALAALEHVLGPSGSPAEPSIKTKEETPVPQFQPLATMRVSAQNFDGLLRSAGALLLESQRNRQVTAQLQTLSRQVTRLEVDLRGLGKTYSTRILDSIERQTRSVARLAGSAHRLQQRTSWSMGRLGKQLQQDVWQARLAPAESLFEGLQKMMRDLARDASKEIEFRATSSGVQADRQVLEALKDPLMHALRNAVSHGVESPRERAQKGKRSAGLVTLHIEARGQRLSLMVEDDGRGLDLPRIAEVAVSQGILSSAEAPRATAADLAQLLFRPGFSTARSVSELSGRGMGLSVVYESVRRLQGEVELHPREHAGVSLRISAPLSVATHRLLLVTCASAPFALPMHLVVRLERIRPENITSSEGKPVVMFEDKPTPFFSLRHLLGAAPQEASPGRLHVAIVRSPTGRVALAVDEFLWESDQVIQDLGPAARNGLVSGGVVLDDGRLAFVLDIAKLLSAPPPAPQVAKPAEPTHKPSSFSILVVDDSLTTRTLEKSILEAHGYRVRVAVDGMEALKELRAEQADLVISDVQMPRMDGFELLAAIKSDAHLRNIPVIVVSSLDRREEQARGLELGANAYIVKGKFDQGELLSAIRQIL